MLVACASPAAADVITINPGETRTIAAGDFLPIHSGDTLTILPGGTLVVENVGTTIINYGDINNRGTIDNDGCFTNYDELVEQLGTVVGIVNNAPILGPIGDLGVNEGDTLTITLSVSDTEVSAGAQTLTYSTDFPYGSLSGNEFTWTPGSGDVGSYDVEFSVSDGCALVSETITITVNDVTDPEDIPEFSTIALPVASILGLLFLFNHRKRRRED